MTTEILTEKLKKLGIIISPEQTYPKKCFRYNNKQVVALYEREFKKDFYFSLGSDQGEKIFKVSDRNHENYEQDTVTDKFMVPLSTCEIIWEDKELVELIDEPFKSITLRDYVCIHHKLPETNKEWLNELLKRV